ncbi:Far upstream element-binding protein 3 [Chlorella vulgaris]
MKAATSLLSQQSFSQQTSSSKGTLTSRAAGGTAALRPSKTAQQHASKPALSHKARVFTAVAATGTAPPPVVTAAPSIDSEHQARSINDSGLQFKFLVPAAVVGAVLGRGGSTVAAIKRETGAYVQFTRPGTATNTPRDRMMIVAVESREQLPRAVALMFEAIEAEGAIDRMRTKQYASDKLFFQQVIPAICAGKVMGPGGEDIKALSERTGCSVVVEGKLPNAAFVPFRLVNYLASEPQQVAAAVAEVTELICQEDKYEASIREVSSVCFRIVEIPERRVGALLGPGGAHIKSLQDVLRCKMGVADMSTKPNSRFVSIWGAPLNVKVAVDVVMLATGLLQQQLAAEDSSAPGTPRSQRFPSSLTTSRAPSVAPSLAMSVNGDME